MVCIQQNPSKFEHDRGTQKIFMVQCTFTLAQFITIPPHHILFIYLYEAVLLYSVVSTEYKFVTGVSIYLFQLSPSLLLVYGRKPSSLPQPPFMGYLGGGGPLNTLVCRYQSIFFNYHLLSFLSMAENPPVSPNRLSWATQEVGVL